MKKVCEITLHAIGFRATFPPANTNTHYEDNRHAIKRIKNKNLYR